MRTKEMLSVFVVFLMLAAAFPLVVSAGDKTSPSPRASERSRFPVIRVNGDSELRNLSISNSWNGDGSVNNPIMIENLVINAGGASNCIFIGNVTISFKIQNCTLSNAVLLAPPSPYYTGSGISIYNTKYAYIRNNTLTYNNYGINLENSAYPKVFNNTISYNQLGLFYFNAGNAEFAYNTVYKNNASGIQISNGGPVWVHNNTVDNNAVVAGSPNSGIMLWGAGSKNNLIECNNLSGNYIGFEARASGITGNVFRDNTVSNCTSYWIEYTNGATGNTFYHNSFYAGGAKTNGITAADKFDNGYPSGGNYWEGYAGTDRYWGPAQTKSGPDGIGDVRFSVEGTVNDSYPWMGPRAWNRVLNLNSTLWYETIQYAVDNASDNNVLFITNSTPYYEDVRLNTAEGLELRGESRERTIVAGSGTRSAIVVSSNDCIVGNLTVTNGAGGEFDGGIQFDSVHRCRAYNVTAEKNYNGFTIVGGTGNKIVNCHANYSSARGIGMYNNAKQCAIIDTTCDFNTIYGLDVFSGCSDNVFDNCTFSRNLVSGTLVNGNSDRNRFVNCTVASNDKYGYVFGPQCKGAEVLGGVVSFNKGPGMHFSSTTGSLVKGVKISSNTGVGIRMEPNTQGNVIHHNQFIDNNVTVPSYLQASDASGNNVWNLSYPFGGNYWSNYVGADNLNGENQTMNGSDGFGDNPQQLADGGRDRYPLIEKPGTPGNVSVLSVVSDRQEAIIGIDEVELTATVNSTFTRGLTLDVEFLLDNVTSLGHFLSNILPNQTSQVVLTTNFSGADGGLHTVTAAFEYLGANYRAVSGEINLTEPWVDITMVSFNATPSSIIIEKGKTVDVSLKAELLNTGVLPGVDFQVDFLVDYNLESSAIVNDSIGPSRKMTVEWIWTVSEDVAIGNHTVSAGIAPGTDDYWKDAVVTVKGVPNVTIDLVRTSMEAGFEGARAELGLTLFNNGTENATGIDIQLLANGTGIGTILNVTVPKGHRTDFRYNWTLPDVDGDTIKNVTFRIPGQDKYLEILVVDRVVRLELLQFVVPDGLLSGKTAEFRASVKNNGTGDAINATLSFMDITPAPQVEMFLSAPFNLSAGGVKEIVGTCNITVPGNANHTFVAICGAGKLNATKFVGAAVVPASIFIRSFTANPQKMTDTVKDSTQTFILTLVFENTGEMPGSVLITITEGAKNIVINENRTVLPGSNGTWTYNWQVRGAGIHTAQLQVLGATGNAGRNVSVELLYKAAATKPAADNTLLMVAVLGILAAVGVAAVLMMRKKPAAAAPEPAEDAEPAKYTPAATETPEKPSGPAAHAKRKNAPNEPAPPASDDYKPGAPEKPLEGDFKP